MDAAAASSLAKAYAAFRARRFREAYANALTHLEAKPEDADGLGLLGLIAGEHGNVEAAEAHFRRAVAAAPNHPRWRAELAKALTRRKAFDAGREEALAAAALNPQDALTLDTIAVALSHAGAHAEALPFFERAIALEPRNPNFLHNLAVSRQFSGDLAGAEAAFRAELALAPESRRSYASLVHLKKQTQEENFIEPLTRQFMAASGEPLAALQLGHALAKTYEDLGDQRTALEWLKRAKALRLSELDDKARPQAALFAAARAMFEEERRTARGFASAAPILIVGMPRTGTTLLDRILSSHGSVASAGELSTFTTLLAQQRRPIDFHALGKAYIDAARTLAGEAPRFIDKMPMNAVFAGLIHLALPEARIIALRRHPMDACLANYRQIFAADADHLYYTLSMEDTARYYVEFDAQMAFWRRVLPPDRFTEVAYEDLVADLEGQAQRLVAHCGLPWDPRCLAFHENDAPVATASSVQVRRPLYSSSIGRWRAIAEDLEPMAAVLRAAGLSIA